MAIFERVSESFDPQAMLERFRFRASAVKSRGLPPVEGAERKAFIDQARNDYLDFAIIADGTATIEDGILRIEVDLRPKE